MKTALAHVFVLILCCCLGVDLSAQTDSLSPKQPPSDSLLKQPPHPPKRAALMSACLPGLGQAYNKKYWKIPIIYVGFGGLGYSVGFNHTYYKRYRDAIRLRYDGDPNTNDVYPLFSDDDLSTLKNYYQRFRDLSIIGMAALYTLNVIDAAVDAHLFYFNVSDDLSLRATPFMLPTPGGPVAGVGLRLGWR
ncbi:MAG: DUF5683 domain-containing protein [Bacteroidia bacterium]|jgi:hypothetical protein|nr:DUF5683 domain-containing protein [Bacteroidia bacterium]